MAAASTPASCSPQLHGGDEITTIEGLAKSEERNGNPSSNMTTIDNDRPLVTLINVFTVEPAKPQELFDLLVEATRTTMRNIPGFISANIHRGLDGDKVVNYGQWRSVGDFQAVMKNPAAKPHMEKVAALAKFEPGLYEVVETLGT